VRVLDLAQNDMFAEEGLVESLQGDITDPNVAAKAMTGIDTVFHCASIIGLHYFWSGRTEKIVVGGTETLLSAAVSAGVRRFVYTSSHNVCFNGDPIHLADETAPYATRYFDGYTRPKIVAEQIVRAHNAKQGLATAVIRPGPWSFH